MVNILLFQIKSIEIYPSLSCSQLTANKVLEMFTSQYTEQLADRKAEIIVRFCRQRKDGFYYEEILEIS